MQELKFTREAVLEAGDGERIPVVVSTEYPVDRGDFVEILAHEPQHVDLARAPLPVVEAHDIRRLPIGVVEELVVDHAAGTLRGFFRPGTSARAREVLADIKAKVVRSLSIGYVLLREVERIGSSAIRFAFQPYEVSVVAVPADPGAGFYRSQDKITMQDTIQAPAAAQRGATNEADRVKSIVALGESYKRYLRDGDINDAVQSGTTPDQFREVIMARMESGASDTSVRSIGMSRAETQRYSLARAIQASVTGDWSKAGLEREASHACARAFGQTPEGFFVPHEYWSRDFNVGTSTEAGNLVATDLRTDLFVDVLRNKLVLARLGVRIIPGLTGNVDIPRKSAASTLGMLTEIGSASETHPDTAKVTLSPKRIGAYVEYSKQALIQSALPLEGLLRDDLLQSSMVLIEDQCLNGPGTGANMRGIRNTTGIGTSTAGANGATVAWSHFLDLEAACGNANAMPGALAGYLTNSKVKSKAKGVQRGTNLDFIIAGDSRADADGGVTLNSYLALFTNNVPSNLTKGTSTTICSAALFSSDWSTMVLGLFGAPDVVVDPYSLAATGQVRITLNQFADFGVRQPAAVAKIEDLLTA